MSRKSKSIAIAAVQQCCPVDNVRPMVDVYQMSVLDPIVSNYTMEADTNADAITILESVQAVFGLQFSRPGWPWPSGEGL